MEELWASGYKMFSQTRSTGLGILGICLWLNVSTRRTPERPRIQEDPTEDLENKHSEDWQTQNPPMHSRATQL